MVPAHLIRNSKYEIRNSKYLKGFSLIELLIIIGLIGVLATGLIIAIDPQTQLAKARDAQRKNDLANIRQALELYYNDTGQYPTNTPEYRIAGGTWGSTWTGVGGSTYMQTVSSDPNPASGRRYAYVQIPGGQGYYLYAALERCQPSAGNNQCFDSQVCFPATGARCTNAPSGACRSSGSTIECTYGVSSSNATP